MDVYKEKAQIKAEQYARQIENLCKKHDVELSCDEGDIELMASVTDPNGKRWWAYTVLET